MSHHLRDSWVADLGLSLILLFGLILTVGFVVGFVVARAIKCG